MVTTVILILSTKQAFRLKSKYVILTISIVSLNTQKIFAYDFQNEKFSRRNLFRLKLFNTSDSHGVELGSALPIPALQL